MFSLESPHLGDSNEYTQYTSFNMIKKIKKRPKLSKICSYGLFSKGLKNEFETAVVNEPSVFEPLKFYCIFLFIKSNTSKTYGSGYKFQQVNDALTRLTNLECTGAWGEK